MPVDVRLMLEKMVRHCENAEKYARGLSYDEFVQNELYLTFAIFSLSQLGELATVLDNRTDCRNRFPDLPWTAMKSLRNNIVHDYDGLRLNVIWAMICEDLPTLKVQLTNILSQSEI